MKRIARIFALVVFAACITSCRKGTADDCFTGNGPDVTLTRYVGNFHALYMQSKVDVRVVQGAEAKVEIAAPRNLLREIVTTVSRDTLHIDNRNTCNFVRGYKRGITITIITPSLGYAANDGVGTITFDPSFKQDTLVVRAESSGDIHIYGSYNEVRTSSHGNGDMYMHAACKSFYVYSYGTNYTYAGDATVTDYVFLHSLSIGDCELNARPLHELDYSINSEGNIYYFGTPPVVRGYIAPGAKGKAEERE